MNTGFPHKGSLSLPQGQPHFPKNCAVPGGNPAERTPTIWLQERSIGEYSGWRFGDIHCFQMRQITDSIFSREPVQCKPLEDTAWVSVFWPGIHTPISHIRNIHVVDWGTLMPNLSKSVTLFNLSLFTFVQYWKSPISCLKLSLTSLILLLHDLLLLFLFFFWVPVPPPQAGYLLWFCSQPSSVCSLSGWMCITQDLHPQTLCVSMCMVCTSLRCLQVSYTFNVPLYLSVYF